MVDELQNLLKLQLIRKTCTMSLNHECYDLWTLSACVARFIHPGTGAFFEKVCGFFEVSTGSITQKGSELTGLHPLWRLIYHMHGFKMILECKSLIPLTQLNLHFCLNCKTFPYFTFFPQQIKYFDKRRDYLKFKEKFEAGQFQPSKPTVKS